MRMPSDDDMLTFFQMHGLKAHAEDKLGHTILHVAVINGALRSTGGFIP